MSEERLRAGVREAMRRMESSYESSKAEWKRNDCDKSLAVATAIDYCIETLRECTGVEDEQQRKES